MTRKDKHREERKFFEQAEKHWLKFIQEHPEPWMVTRLTGRNYDIVLSAYGSGDTKRVRLKDVGLLKNQKGLIELCRKLLRRQKDYLDNYTSLATKYNKALDDLISLGVKDPGRKVRI
jgi:hypothetical protein